MNGLDSKMNRDVYSALLDKISYSEKDKIEVDRIKKDFSTFVDQNFQSSPSYRGFKFIGSIASGNTLKWKKDLDGIIILDSYKKEEFRDIINGMCDKINGLKFTEKCGIVRDHFSGWYENYELGIGAVHHNADPMTSLEGDLIMHPDFSSSHLSENQRLDVILTKLFFRNSGVYGGIVGGGFPLEQLVAKYKSFAKVIQKLSKGHHIFVDFSHKYSGAKTPLTITYPFCGLDNMSKGISDKEFKRLSDYACQVLEDQEIFIEDSLLTLNYEFWKRRAHCYGQSKEFSFPDVHLNKKENNTLNKIIKKTNPKRILDVGCGNGYNTLEIISNFNGEVRGLDLNKTAVNVANDLSRQLGRTSFEIGKIEKMPFSSEYFDFIYAKRAITNLPTRNLQRKAIDECFRILSPDGTFCLTDLFVEGYEKINRLRSKVGLDAINLPKHAELFTEEGLSQLIKGRFELVDIIDNTSTYYFISRIIYPAIAERLGIKIKSDSIINWVASKMPSIGSLGINKTYVFKK